MMIPSRCRQLVGIKLTQRFADAVKIASKDIKPLQPHEVLVKTRFVGINASDLNVTAGRYKHLKNELPLALGFEGVGNVVRVGESVENIGINQAVCYMQQGSFAEYLIVPAAQLLPVPAADPEYVTLLVSGLTAAIALSEIAALRPAERVLVTGAAGGTGQFAVQWAKMAGCHVIGTCGGPEKACLLRELGCHRVVDYQAERLRDVLRNEYPKGVDVVYEGVGGDMFDTAVNNLAMHARLLVIGFISGYESELGVAKSHTAATLPVRLLTKSASVRGFFLFNHASLFKKYWRRLLEAKMQGGLRCIVDCGPSSAAPFRGLESIVPAVEYLYSRKSLGKVIVELNPDDAIVQSRL